MECAVYWESREPCRVPGAGALLFFHCRFSSPLSYSPIYERLAGGRRDCSGPRQSQKPPPDDAEAGAHDRTEPRPFLSAPVTEPWHWKRDVSDGVDFNQATAAGAPCVWSVSVVWLSVLCAMCCTGCARTCSPTCSSRPAPYPRGAWRERGPSHLLVPIGHIAIAHGGDGPSFLFSDSPDFCSSARARALSSFGLLLRRKVQRLRVGNAH
jgi:hypothetical protein